MNYIKQNIAIILIGAAVFAASGAGAYMLLQKGDNNKPVHTSPVVTKDPTPAVADDSNEACDLFSREDLASALGGAFSEGEPGYASDIPQSIVNPGKKSEDLKNYACSFEQENDGTPAGKAAALNLAVDVNNFSNEADAQEYLDGFVEMLEKNDGATKVDNTGDQAFFLSSESGEEAIPGIELFYIRVNTKVYSIVAGSDNPIDRQDVRRRLIELTKEL